MAFAEEAEEVVVVAAAEVEVEVVEPAVVCKVKMYIGTSTLGHLY